MIIPFRRVTTDNISKEKSVWIKSVYIFGIKVAQWEYTKTEKTNKGVGF